MMRIPMLVSSATEWQGYLLGVRIVKQYSVNNVLKTGQRCRKSVLRNAQIMLGSSRE